MASLPTRRRYKFTNAPVVTTLAAGMNISDTSFTITTPTNWPSASSDYFWVTIGAGTTTEERLLCSGTSGTTVTVVSRGADGTSAAAHSQGDSVWVSWSATDADDANAHVSSSASTSSINVHGLGVGSSVVGTIDSQTLTNKTLTGPKISGTSSGTTTIVGSSVASGTVTVPAVTGTLITSADSGTVTDGMLAGSITPSKVTGTAAVLGANSFTGTQTVTPSSGSGVVVNAAASAVGVVVKSNATTPGDVQQWQDSSGNVNARVTANAGGLVAPEAVASNSSASGSVTLDCSAATTHLLTLSGNISGLTLSNLPQNGSLTLTLVLTQPSSGSTYTMTWPASYKWAGGSSAPALSTAFSATDIFTLVVNRSAGSTSVVYAFLSGKGFV